MPQIYPVMQIKRIVCLPLAPYAGRTLSLKAFMYKPVENLCCHGDLLDLVTSSPIRGSQVGEMSKLGSLIDFVKHAIWADSFISYAYCCLELIKS
jgi:hypothetical protein